MKQIASAETLNGLDGVIFEMVELFVRTDIRTSIPTNVLILSK
jgi:hypothetical protein